MGGSPTAARPTAPSVRVPRSCSVLTFRRRSKLEPSTLALRVECVRAQLAALRSFEPTELGRRLLGLN